MPMARKNVYFDEREDVLASTDLLAIAAPKLRKQPSYWKWMIIAAHNGLQGALVCAIQDTSATNVLSKESATKMLKYLETLEGDRPQEYLADFVTLLKRYRKKYPCHGLTTEQLKHIHKLHKQFRNNFAHFVPKGWWIEIARLPAIIESTLDLIEAAMQQHQVVIHLNGNMKRRLEQNLAATRASSSLAPASGCLDTEIGRDANNSSTSR
jgi:hypothetical protein